MLPDYLDLKAELRKWLIDFLDQRRRVHSGVLDQIGRVRYFEGEQRAFTDASGDTDVAEWTDISAVVTINNSELPHLTLNDLLIRLDEAAAEMARQEAEMFYRTLSEATEKVGNVVDAKRQLSGQTMLDAFRKLDIDFDSKGRARMPDIHVNPKTAPTLTRALTELESDPALKKKFEFIMEQKREEWRAREASRKLVG